MTRQPTRYTLFPYTTLFRSTKKEEAKSMSEEGVTGAFIRDLKSSTRTVCFVTGSGEHQIDNRTHRPGAALDRKSTRLNSSHEWISYAVFCLKKKKRKKINYT